jgi:hypothetical protein
LECGEGSALGGFWNFGIADFEIEKQKPELSCIQLNSGFFL